MWQSQIIPWVCRTLGSRRINFQKASRDPSGRKELIVQLLCKTWGWSPDQGPLSEKSKTLCNEHFTCSHATTLKQRCRESSRSHKGEVGENGSELRIRGKLGPTVSTASGGALHLEKQLCVKEPVLLAAAAAIAAVATANGY